MKNRIVNGLPNRLPDDLQRVPHMVKLDAIALADRIVGSALAGRPIQVSQTEAVAIPDFAEVVQKLEAKLAAQEIPATPSQIVHMDLCRAVAALQAEGERLLAASKAARLSEAQSLTDELPQAPEAGSKPHITHMRPVEDEPEAQS